MYLSHNIVNYLVRLEHARTLVSTNTTAQASQKIIAERDGKNIFFFANDLGIKITLKEGIKAIHGELSSDDDFRKQLIDNLVACQKFAQSLSESKDIRIDKNTFLQLNETISRGLAQGDKIGFREPQTEFAKIYDDLIESVAPEHIGIATEPVLEQFLSEAYSLEGVNEIYRISELLFKLIRLQPFGAFNKITIGFVAEVFLGRTLGHKHNYYSPGEFLCQKQVQINQAFAHPELPTAEVVWHELFLENLSSSFEELALKFKQESEAQENHANKPFLDLNKRQLKILKYLQTIPTVKREDYVQMMNVSPMTAYRDINQLMKHKLIRATGNGRGTKYLLASR